MRVVMSPPSLVDHPAAGLRTVARESRSDRSEARPGTGAGRPSASASLRSTTSIASARPHQRQVTDSTVSSRTSVSSTPCSPARSKCQNSVVRRVRRTSKRVRLPQPPQRQRWRRRDSDGVSPRDRRRPRRRARSACRRGLPGSCRRPAYRPDSMSPTTPDVALGVPAHVRRARAPAARRHLLRRRPRDDRRSAEAGSMITEIGAVKVRGGEVLGEFQTLVNPHTEIPPFIAVLTGITNSMVADAPPIESALPAFLEFAPGTVLVAHNAPFDVGLPRALRRASRAGRGRRSRSLDTARLARRVITRDDAPNCKLSSLASAFRSSDDAQPPGALRRARHRRRAARPDGAARRPRRAHARGAADVHARGSATAQRRKRHLAEDLPHAPGVYLFRDEQRPGALRRHLARPAHPGAHPTSPPPRPAPGWARWSASPTRSTGIVCATAAGGRGARAAADRRSTSRATTAAAGSRRRCTALKLTREPWPRLSLVRQVARRRRRLPRPVRARAGRAEKCLAALHETFPIRQCTDRLGRSPRPGRPACWPRWAAASRRATAASTMDDLRRGRGRGCATPCCTAPTRSSRRSPPGWTARAEDERFEEAGVHRDRLSAFVRAASRTQRLGSLTRCPELVAARREDDGRWAVHVVRHGRLAAAGVIPSGRRTPGVASTSCATSAETVPRRPGPDPGRERRGVRAGPALARAAGRPPRRTSRASGPARSRGATRHLAVHDAVEHSPAVAGAVRRAARDSYGASTCPLTFLRTAAPHR